MNRYHRRSIRLQDYDYTQAGAYFITLCAYQRECLFGEITGDEVALSPIGKSIQACWENIPQLFSFVELDAYVVMPNHFHAILCIVNNSHLHKPSQSDENGAHPLRLGAPRGSLPSVVGNFKSVAARKVNSIRMLTGESVWQRNYYERIIRNERELHTTREYIDHNPQQWALDRENPGLIRRPTPSRNES